MKLNATTIIIGLIIVGGILYFVRSRGGLSGLGLGGGGGNNSDGINVGAIDVSVPGVHVGLPGGVHVGGMGGLIPNINMQMMQGVHSQQHTNYNSGSGTVHQVNRQV